ncbi:hypothetical protein Asppvi_004454 [Aspergillus pseudoviridinutans]|uniref:Carrier domain-containing protein n=1 Tax=Aspergillus pseudoviridinutans TaxID=1517512 RepID=A0A9P3B7P6_9EURO|nr:uncharacterized protein Asppvi_004454 [Aspergillus pseudoviridinutans]GIJ85595.1 hypothetical protein Asppvi_004454 [Aspergillus pseudoviridinutans]
MGDQRGTGDSQTVTQRLNRVVEQHPDSLAVICTHQPANLYGFCSTELDERKYRQKPYLRWTFNTLSNAKKCLAAGLQAKGVKQGTPIFVFCQNQVEFILSTLAAYHLGLIHVPMKSETLGNLEEAQHIVNAVIDHEQPKQVVILTDNESAAKKVDQLKLPLPALKILVEGHGANHGGWIPFASLFEGQKPTVSEPCDQKQSFKECSVFFTSGSTGLPKGCFIQIARWFEVLEPSLGLGSASSGDVLAVTVPSTHAFGYICTTVCLLRGACVLFPGPKFSPQETIEAMHQEKCTMAAMVSTMVYSLAEIYNASKQQMPLNLKKVTFAGMATTPDILKICRDTFGVSAVENFFGMTEGVFTTTGFVQDLDTIIKGNDVSIGRPVAKSDVRICAPDDNRQLPTGSYGELHCSGYSTIQQYIGRRSDDFYEADGKIWFKTGDRGFIDHDSQLYIAGRYKDMIVRGGQNISPSRIEAVLTQHPEFRDLEPQIVAASDPTAGEIPFVVTNREIDNELVKQLQDTVRTSLGVTYVPSGIVSLQALGLDDYPRTAVGKIKKTKLTESVREYQQQSQTPVDTENPDSSSQLVQAAKATWARVLGFQDADFDVNTPVAQLADSITNLTARDRIQKTTGKNVPLEEWIAATTFQDQITLLERSETEKGPSERSPSEKRTGPPRLEDMVHLDGDKDELKATKTAVEKTIAKNGLSWDDIEDVFPCTDFMQMICRSRIINTWNIRTSIVSQGASIQGMRAALEAAIANNPLMRAFLVDDPATLGSTLSLYVTIRQNQKFLDQCILDYGTVNTLKDLERITMDYPFKDHAMLPGPLFRALVVFVQEVNSAAVITNISHGILDIVYLRLFNEDIDCALGEQSLRPHIPFKAWADNFYIHRTSTAAQSAVNFHAEYLRDLKEHHHVLWPHPTYHLTVSSERANKDGHLITFSAPSFAGLRRRYPKLTPPIILKAALALLVISRTNHTHAVFLNLEAAREGFPFSPDSQGSFEAADVAGPTFGGVVNLIAYNPKEPVLDYMMRVQHAQSQLTEHSSVPWYEVFKRLDLPAAATMSEIAESLIFNWVSELGPLMRGRNPFERMTLKQTHIRTKLGMLVNAGAGGPDGSQIIIQLHGALANMSSMWVENAAEELKNIAQWLADERSWSLPVAEFTRHLH